MTDNERKLAMERLDELATEIDEAEWEEQAATGNLRRLESERESLLEDFPEMQE